METEDKLVLMCPRVDLYKISSNIERKQFKKIQEWKVDSPCWSGRLRILGDPLNYYIILFENRNNHQAFAKCLINEYPSDLIEPISDSGKHLAIQLEDKCGKRDFYGLVFDDRSDSNEFRSVLKQLKGNTIKIARHLNAIIDTKSTTSNSNNKINCSTAKFNQEFELKFFKTYPLELAKLNDFPNNFIRAINRLQIAHNENLRQFYDENDEQLFHLDELFKRFKIQAKEQVNHVIIAPRVMLNDINNSTKQKKRTATLAEISMRNEDEDEEKENFGETSDQDAAVPELKPTKAKKTGKKKIKKTASSKKGSLEKLREAKKASHNKPASKKQRMSSNESLESIDETDEVVKQKSDIKTKSSFKFTTKSQQVAKITEEDEDNTQQKASTQPTTINSKIPQIAKIFSTPSKNTLTTKPPQIDALQSTAKKRPMTRAAGKVMQMVNMVEQKLMKSTTCLQPSNSLTSADLSAKTQRANLKTIRSSIEQRKLRVSQAKLEAKRKSVKKAIAFIKTINETHNQSNLNMTVSKPVTHDVTIDESRLQIDAKFNADLLKNPSIQSQYRVTTLKTTLSNVSTKNPERKQSFNRFMERNTPSKLTKTEIDEKRKAELLAKEKKDQERLAEIEREKQAKVEEAKRKREEKMRQIKESKAKRQEEEEKRREEAEMRAREIEENKKKLLEEKRREEQERARLHAIKIAEEKKRLEELEAARKEKLQQSIMNSAQKPAYTKTGYGTTCAKKPLETTFTLNTPAATSLIQNKVLPKNSGLAPHVMNNQLYNHHLPQSYAVTPLQEPIAKPRNPENYDVSDLRSDDETDDEEDPSKPIPLWAREPHIQLKAKEQCLKAINYTKIFRTSSNTEIKLEEIFKTRRKKFNERSSSANWTTPPIWATGINGEESFRKLHQ